MRFAVAWLSAAALVAAGQQSLRFEDTAARAAVARELKQTREAVELYNQAVALRPEWGEGWWHLGTSLYELGEHAQARDAFRRLLELEPTGGPAWAFLALCEFQLKSYDQALEKILHARKLGVGQNDQLILVTDYHAAILLNRAGDFDSAKKLLLTLAKRHQQKSALIEALGLNALAMTKLPSELPLDEKDLVIRAGRAAFYAAFRRLKEAQEEYENLIRLYPNKPNVHYNYGVFLQWENTDAALREFHREIEVWPSHVTARLSIALEYIRRGELNQALPYAQQAASLSPGRVETRALLGRILLELGETDRAIQELQAAVERDPANSQSRYLLSRAYQKAGRKAEAERERQEFLRLKTKGKS